MVEQKSSPECKCQKCGARFWSKILQIRCFDCRVSELTAAIEEIKRLAVEGMKVEYR